MSRVFLSVERTKGYKVLNTPKRRNFHRCFHIMTLIYKLLIIKLLCAGTKTVRNGIGSAEIWDISLKKHDKAHVIL
jgi:hypothetical protein